MKKRILSLFLCASLFCLIACGKKADDTPADPFVAFANGSTTATVASDCPIGSVLRDVPETFTVSQITDLIRNQYTADAAADFALVSSQSGEAFLLLRYSGLAVSGSGDGSYALLFFCEEDGTLVLTHALRSDPKNEVILRLQLVITGTTIDGADSTTEWCGFIDESRRFHSLYQLRRFQGQQIPKYLKSSTVSEMNWTEDDVFEILDASGDTTFDFRCAGADGGQKQAQMIEWLSESGYDYANNLEELMFSAISDYGVALWPPFENWTPLPLK